ncbi:MAG: hypothetical protein JXA97_00800 [Anaerolineales bacterium]|nr:hypothetical protein [Anaerolineales bacterium]
MSSFTRTIPAYKPHSLVDDLLASSNSTIPLSFRPGRAEPGDFIYLIHQGFLRGRACIAAIEPVSLSPDAPSWARWLIRCHGHWELPPRPIPAQGHQGVRYLSTHDQERLQHESWIVR